MSVVPKIGDCVQCINNKSTEKYLTEGKLYKVIYVEHRAYSLMIKITDDKGESNFFMISRFKLSTRKQKLERILCQENLK